MNIVDKPGSTDRLVVSANDDILGGLRARNNFQVVSQKISSVLCRFFYYRSSSVTQMHCKSSDNYILII